MIGYLILALLLVLVVWIYSLFSKRKGGGQ